MSHPRKVLPDLTSGTATEIDVQDGATGSLGRLCELVYGVLVGKAVGNLESRLTAADGFYRPASGFVCCPDVSFVAYDRIPDDADAMPEWIPSLAVEISDSGARPPKWIAD